MLIKDIPNQEKPRERLLNYGSENLTNEDLLAIILRNGTKNISVKELALEILSKIDNIHDLNQLTIEKLLQIKGMGIVKAITLIASLELGKRVYETNDVSYKMNLNTSKLVFETFKNKFNHYQEEFMVVFLNNKKKLIDYKIIFRGTLNEANIHPREIFKLAVLLSSSAIILIHNHPSHDLTPSNADIEITNNLISIGKLMGIPVLDHLIISPNNYYSFFEHKDDYEKVAN